MKIFLSFFYLTQLFFTPITPPPTTDCDVVVFSELQIADQEFSVDFDTVCELDYLILEVFDQWGNHIYGVNDDKLEWGSKKIILEKTKMEDSEPVLDGTYFYTLKYRFENDKDSHKKSGTIFTAQQ